MPKTICEITGKSLYVSSVDGDTVTHSFAFKADNTFRLTGQLLKGAGEFSDIEKIVWDHQELQIHMASSWSTKVYNFHNVSSECIESIKYFFLKDVSGNIDVINMAIDVLGKN